MMMILLRVACVVALLVLLEGIVFVAQLVSRTDVHSNCVTPIFPFFDQVDYSTTRLDSLFTQQPGLHGDGQTGATESNQE
jgi:hypothetical protein